MEKYKTKHLLSLGCLMIFQGYPVNALTNPRYLNYPNNCYEDQTERDLPHKLVIPSGLPDSTIWCQSQCGGLGYKYAGLQYSYECFCGNSFGKYGKKPDSTCQMPCQDTSGNKKCGGSWRNNVYLSIGLKVDALEYPNNCYEDQDERDLPHKLVIPSGLPDSTIWCKSQCGGLGYKYAGLQYSSECFCGNSYGKYGNKPASTCQMPCQDTSGNKKCGGSWRNNVYLSIGSNPPVTEPKFCGAGYYLADGKCFKYVSTDLKDSFESDHFKGQDHLHEQCKQTHIGGPHNYETGSIQFSQEIFCEYTVSAFLSKSEHTYKYRRSKHFKSKFDKVSVSANVDVKHATTRVAMSFAMSKASQSTTSSDLTTITETGSKITWQPGYQQIWRNCRTKLTIDGNTLVEDDMRLIRPVSPGEKIPSTSQLNQMARDHINNNLKHHELAPVTCGSTYIFDTKFDYAKSYCSCANGKGRQTNKYEPGCEGCESCDANYRRYPVSGKNKNVCIIDGAVAVYWYDKDRFGVRQHTTRRTNGFKLSDTGRGYRGIEDANSFKLYPGYEMTICSQENFHGTCETYDSCSSKGVRKDVERIRSKIRDDVDSVDLRRCESLRD